MTPGTGGLVCDHELRRESDALGPVPHAAQLGPQFPTGRGQPVPMRMLDQAR